MSTQSVNSSTSTLVDLSKLNSASQYPVPAIYAPNLGSMIDGTNKFGQYVQHEQRLLEDQKNLVNDAALAKSRQVALNESVRKRTQDYSYLMMVVCIFLGVLLLLAFLKPSLTFIPSIIFDLLIVVVVASAIIYVIFAIQKIRARDRIDYDTLDLPSPAIDPADAAGDPAGHGAGPSVCQTHQPADPECSPRRGRAVGYDRPDRNRR